MGNPDADGGSTHSKEEQRLLDAYRRYERAYRDARPGTAAAATLARARLDLTLLLQAAGEPIADELLAQLQRDADSVVRTTPPIEDDLN